MKILGLDLSLYQTIDFVDALILIGATISIYDARLIILHDTVRILALKSVVMLIKYPSKELYPLEGRQHTASSVPPAGSCTPANLSITRELSPRESRLRTRISPMMDTFQVRIIVSLFY